ncbi:hypothetical protein ACFL34_05860, partial [Candidatus Sumerlaeota bacterium]
MTIGKYTIEPIPASEPIPAPSVDASVATNHYLLRFVDDIGPDDTGSSPEVEAEFFLSCLSLMLGSKLTIGSLMANAVCFSDHRTDVYKKYNTELKELPDLPGLVEKLQCKNAQIARQFIRAAGAYRTGVNLIGEDDTLSFFLFTVAVECLSNKLVKEGGKCDRFVDLILKYSPSELGQTAEIRRELLETTYKQHRCGFTHEGEP